MGDQTSRQRHRGFVGLLLGILVTVPALAMAIASGGMGHGDYGYARALFPIPMLLTVFTQTITLLSMALALIQFPLYGYAFFRAKANPTWKRFSMVLVAAHVCSVIICFSGVLQGFS